MRIHALHGTALAAPWLRARAHDRPDAAPGDAARGVAATRAALPAGARRRDDHVPAGSLDGKAVYESTFSPVVRDGSVAGATMTSRDITAQKSAEAELANASGRLQAILDHSPMAIYMRDTDQRWIVANPEACGILGKSPEQLLGNTARRRPFRRRSTRTWRPTTAQVLSSGDDMSFDETVPRCAHGQGAPRLVAEVPRPRHRGPDRRNRRRVARRHRPRAGRARAGRGARALRDGILLGSRRHGRQPRQRRRQRRGHPVQPGLRGHART